MDKIKLAEKHCELTGRPHAIKDYLAGFDAAESIANEKIQELERENRILKAQFSLCKKQRDKEIKGFWLEGDAYNFKKYIDSANLELEALAAKMREQESP